MATAWTRNVENLVTPIEGRCQYWLPRMNRCCSRSNRPNSPYCTQHNRTVMAVDTNLERAPRATSYHDHQNDHGNNLNFGNNDGNHLEALVALDDGRCRYWLVGHNRRCSRGSHPSTPFCSQHQQALQRVLTTVNINPDNYSQKTKKLARFIELYLESQLQIDPDYDY